MIVEVFLIYGASLNIGLALAMQNSKLFVLEPMRERHFNDVIYRRNSQLVAAILMLFTAAATVTAGRY